MTLLERLEFMLSIDVFENEEDPLRFTPPQKPGLYLVGSTHFNPYTKEEFYLIKVGTSKNICQRMKSYKGVNPLMFHIDYATTEKYPNLTEYDCHTILFSICENRIDGCDEWVKVSRETYLQICEKKFNFFEEKILTK